MWLDGGLHGWRVGACSVTLARNPFIATEAQFQRRAVGVTAQLRYVDPTRTPGLFARSYAAFAARPAARFISRHINWKIDPLLLRVTRGRVATTLVFPTALLETRGARTGARRRNAIIYFHDGDRVIIVASNAGSSK